MGGVSSETTETDLMEHFTQFGPIVELTLMIDKVSHRSRGFAFVYMGSDESITECLKAVHQISGKIVDVKLAQPRYKYITGIPRIDMYANGNVFEQRLGPRCFDQQQQSYPSPNLSHVVARNHGGMMDMHPHEETQYFGRTNVYVGYPSCANSENYYSVSPAAVNRQYVDFGHPTYATYRNPGYHAAVNPGYVMNGNPSYPAYQTTPNYMEYSNPPSTASQVQFACPNPPRNQTNSNNAHYNNVVNSGASNYMY